MPLILSALAASGKQTIAFVDNTASRLFRALLTPRHVLEDVSASSPADDDTSAPSGQSVLEGPELEPENQDPSASSDYDTDSSEESQPIEGNSADDDSDVQLETHEQVAGSASLVIDADVPTVHTVLSRRRQLHPGTSRRVPYHPYIHSTGTFAPRHISRSRSLPPAPPPVRAPVAERCLSAEPSIAPTKRPRDADSDSDDDEPERPRTRRRFSIVHPVCTRDACGQSARYSPEQEEDDASTSQEDSDEEDTWSSAAQPSDTEADPNDPIFRIRTTRYFRKRLRDDGDDDDAQEHASKRFKGSRNGH
ncbi:hypothetical protein C2E23DRAFT_898307 [Lenzites betulinus]|nr:hypothetical protein C2E23DRAFT_898307 [Lenzites betulinus]